MEKKLRELQLVQLEILNVIDNICITNRINYSLYAGTLIGAVRHNGFIPWDDDLDICMLRSEYNRFIKAWGINSPDGYVLQNKENTPTFTQSFSKIRKTHTTFIQYDWEKGKYNTGIFVDIFPIDKVPQSKIKKYLFYWNCIRYQLYTRELVPNNTSLLTRLFVSILLKTSSHSKRLSKRNKLLKKITMYNEDSELPFVDISVIWTMKIALPKTLFSDYVKLRFEDGEYSSFSQWNEYLKRTYGDYMQFPPKEEQTWTHHPLILDFKHDYEELRLK